MYSRPTPSGNVGCAYCHNGVDTPVLDAYGLPQPVSADVPVIMYSLHTLYAYRARCQPFPPSLRPQSLENSG